MNADDAVAAIILAFLAGNLNVMLIFTILDAISQRRNRRG